MSAKSILEADGKAILSYHLTRAPVIKPTPLPKSATHNPPPKLASLYFAADADIKGVLDQAEATYPWLLTPGSKFVAKPDQLIKRRGKSGLLALNKPWSEARDWIEARAGKAQRVETVDGVLRQFLVEPFVPHEQDTEYYININSVREVRSSPFSYSLSFCVSIGLGRLRAVQMQEKEKDLGHKCTHAAIGSSFKSSRAISQVLFKAGRAKGALSRPTHCRAHTLYPDKRAGFHMSKFPVSSFVLTHRSCRGLFSTFRVAALLMERRLLLLPPITSPTPS
jgi:hypothetical protein